MLGDDFLPIYSLAEWHYCPRSAFLSWCGAEREDRVTPAYQRMREEHAKSNEPARRDKDGVRSETAVRLLHRELRITGRADAVEWENGAPVPVEYKNCADDLPRHIVAQLALQALCLAEMHAAPVLHGFIFRTAERRRIRVELDDATLAWVREGVAAFRAALPGGLAAFPRHRQPGCAGCIYRAGCWPEEFPM
jgi:CRISPR-associated exonuclease Cas4